MAATKAGLAPQIDCVRLLIDRGNIDLALRNGADLLALDLARDKGIRKLLTGLAPLDSVAPQMLAQAEDCEFSSDEDDDAAADERTQYERAGYKFDDADDDKKGKKKAGASGDWPSGAKPTDRCRTAKRDGDNDDGDDDNDGNDDDAFQSSESDEEDGVEAIIMVGEDANRVQIFGAGRRVVPNTAADFGPRGPPPPVPPRVTRQQLFKDIDKSAPEESGSTEFAAPMANVAPAAAAQKSVLDDDDDNDMPPLEDFDVPIGQFEDAE